MLIEKEGAEEEGEVGEEGRENGRSAICPGPRGLLALDGVPSPDFLASISWEVHTSTTYYVGKVKMGLENICSQDMCVYRGRYHCTLLLL